MITASVSVSVEFGFAFGLGLSAITQISKINIIVHMSVFVMHCCCSGQACTTHVPSLAMPNARAPRPLVPAAVFSVHWWKVPCRRTSAFRSLALPCISVCRCFFDLLYERKKQNIAGLIPSSPCSLKQTNKSLRLCL